LSGKLRFVRTFSTQVAAAVPLSVDYVFIDGDHALDAITTDWAFWSDRLQAGGIIALHDVLLPAGKPQTAEFGSHQYFRTHIRNDRRFEILDQRDSLVVLRKI
jgi:predicted O-methyltransferase YrrM